MDAVIVGYADGHVDARGPGGFNAEEGLPQNSVEALKSLALTVDKCNDVKADLLVVAGDLFDTGKPSPEIVARVTDQFRRLDGTKVWLIDGNHDQQGILSGHRTAIASYFAEQPWAAGAWSVAGVGEFNGLHVASLPWIRVSGSNALGATNEALARHLDELAASIKGNGPSVLFGHMTVAECAFDSGKRGSEVNMVTSTLEASVPVAQIDEGPWSVARLGHIHKRQQLSDKTGYIGSPYKVSFGEANDAKGIDIISINAKGKATVDFHKFSVRELVKIDLTKGAKASFAAKPGDVVRLIADSETIEKAEALVKTFVAAGAQSHIHRIPDSMVAIQREAQYQTEMAPADALAAYLDKKDIAPDKRPAIIAAFADVAEHCGHQH